VPTTSSTYLSPDEVVTSPPGLGVELPPRNTTNSTAATAIAAMMTYTTALVSCFEFCFEERVLRAELLPRLTFRFRLLGKFVLRITLRCHGHLE
jgi:hypothetical protein